MSNKGDGERPWADLVKEYSQSSLRDLAREDIERLTVASIHEHRRRLDAAQILSDEIEALGAHDAAALRSRYEEAAQANDDQQMVVQMLLEILGSMPALAEA